MLIYKITNQINGKIYIGQTVMPLIRRWRVHKSCKRKSPLTNALAKYGHENFKIEEVTRAVSTEELNKLEIAYIAQYESIAPKGYNLAAGGSSSRGCIPWNKGKKGGKPPKSAFKKGLIPWNKGKTTPLDVRAKQSAAAQGRLPVNSKPVLCITTGVVYPSAGAAANALGLIQSSVTAVCRGEYKTSKGFKFKYAA